jgi:hypothetical protein
MFRTLTLSLAMPSTEIVPPITDELLSPCGVSFANGLIKAFVRRITPVKSAKFFSGHKLPSFFFQLRPFFFYLMIFTSGLFSQYPETSDQQNKKEKREPLAACKD